MARRVASGCLVFHDGNCLLLRRSALEDTMQGLWEMPAGKIESDLDGSPRENAIRETLEEAGIALGDVAPLGEHLTDSKRFYGFLGVSDTANVELSFEHDAYVWMSTPDILTAVAADEMMVGHHTVYFLQQLLDGAEDFMFEAENFYLPDGRRVPLASTSDFDLVNNEFTSFDLEGVDFIPWSEGLFTMPLNCGICNRPSQYYEDNDNVCNPCSTKWTYDEFREEGEGYYRNEDSLEAESFAAESGDVRINYNANCPACISIMSLIGEEKRETDPAGTYWGDGAYQNEVEHLQGGDWDFGDGQGRVRLHEPLLGGGTHHVLLGLAAGLLHEYNNNGNGNLLEMGENEECYDCGGTGEYDCYSDCDDGKQECYACDGTGAVEDDEGEDEVCDDCDGSGEEDCNSCDGQSWCNECGGSGDFWNEEIVSGISRGYQMDIDTIYAYGDSDISDALDRLVEGLESGQLRTTYGQEMYNDANHKLYNDLHDAIIYYVINTPNKPLPEGESQAAETFEAEKITKEELIEYLDWLEDGFGFYFDASPRAVRFRELLAGDVQINSADVDFMDKDEFILLGAEGLPRGVAVHSFKTVSNVYYNGKLYRKFEGRRHRERAESIAEWMMQKLSQNPRRFDYLRFGAEDYSEEDAIADGIIGQTIFNYVQLKDYLLQNLTDEAIEFLDYNIQVAFEELIDEDMRQQVEHVMNTNRFEAEFISINNPFKYPSNYVGNLEQDLKQAKQVIKMVREICRVNVTYDWSQWGAIPVWKEFENIVEIIDEKSPTNFESESTSKPARVEIKRATIDPYKLTAVFYDKDDKKIKTTHFGDERYEDYTIHKDKERLKNYNTRHGAKSAGEKWQKPMTAGALSKWILWNKPSLTGSFADYKRRFKLKGDLKAKTSGGRKRAETFATEYTPSQTLGDYDARELVLSSVSTGDFFTDSLKFSTTRKAAEEDEDAKKLREYEKTYGKKQAKIRMRLKRKIYKERSMGTKAGQWSARKSQKLKREYEEACERAGLKPYKGGKTEKQDDLEDWSDQKWKTSSGKKSSKTGEPYFPAKAVEALKKKGLYTKAKRQKAKATKEGKQNARYSDDIRKVVAKYRAESFQADTDVVLYFATSSKYIQDIERFGLEDPLLSLDMWQADENALEIADTYGGEAIVIQVSAFDDLLEQVDQNSNLLDYYGTIPPAALYVMDWDDIRQSWV